MANMPSANKRHVTARVNVETCIAVEKKFGKPGDTSTSIAFIRALEEATRDVELTDEDYREIADEIRRNRLAANGGH